MQPFDDHPLPSTEEILQLTRLDPIPSYLSPSLYLSVFDAVVDLRLRGIEADWTVILDSGWRCLGLAHAALQLHQDHASSLRRSLSLQQLSDDFADAVLNVSTIVFAASMSSCLKLKNTLILPLLMARATESSAVA